MSSPPNSRRTASTRVPPALGSRRSSALTATLPPLPRIDCATSSSARASRPVSMRSQPSSPKASAMPRPMPRLDPVTSATFPFNPSSIQQLSLRRGWRREGEFIALGGEGMKGAPRSAGHAAFTVRPTQRRRWPGQARPSRSGATIECSPALNLVRSPDDEIVPVRHLHLRQGLGVHHVVLADDFVEREYIGAERVEFIVGQRFRHL